MQNIDFDTAISLPHGAARREENALLFVEQDRSTDERAWDRFAAACGASFRAAHRAAGAWQVDHHPLHRMRRYAIWLEQRTGRLRIGQTAIGFGPQLRVFAEGLQLMPEHRGLWRQAMSAVLAKTGAGLYHYGSGWSLEPPREGDCAAIAGATLVKVQPITMYSVAFARWTSWDAYLREISSNARRNAKKAEKLQERLTIGIRHGFEMLRDAPHLIRLRRSLYARKQVRFSAVVSAFRLMLRAAVMRENAFIAVARVDGAPVCAFGGIAFGENTYFVDAGAVREDNGVYWFLMLRMLHDAYRRASHGRFVTGPYYQATPVSTGLDFFRHQCRAMGTPTSEFVFRYNPPRGSAA